MAYRYIIGDTETTGLGPKRQPIEVALLEITADLEILGEASTLLKPSCPITAEATDIHGLTDADVANAPTMAEWIESTFGGPLEGEIFLIGYRVGFDRPLLAPIGNIVKMWDALNLANRLVHDTKNRKLQTMRERFNLPGGDAHRAMGDVMTTYQLMQVLLPTSGRGLAEHCAVEFEMVHQMPWGKHEGTLLGQLPRGYRDWLLGLEELDPDLRKSLEIVGKTDIVYTGRRAW